MKFIVHQVYPVRSIVHGSAVCAHLWKASRETVRELDLPGDSSAFCGTDTPPIVTQALSQSDLDGEEAPPSVLVVVTIRGMYAMHMSPIDALLRCVA